MEKYGLITSIMGIVTEKENSPPGNGLRHHRGKLSSSSPLRQVQKRSPTTTTDQLVSILEENSGPDGNSSRQAICLESKPPRRRESATAIGNILQVHLQRGGGIAAKYGGVGSSAGKQKIPRPANAFMLFANEWRKKLAIQNPRESNKDISVRLGVLWKNMAKGIKEKYFALAREVDAEHKRKYPDYVYNPKEARLRKAMREQSRELSRQSILQTAIASAASSGNGSGSGAVTSSSFLNHPLSCSSSSTGGAVSPLQNGSPSVNPGRIINPWFHVGPAAAAAAASSSSSSSSSSSAQHLKPIISPRMMAAHQRTLEKTKEAMRKQVECAASGVFSSGGSGNPSSGSGYPGEFGGHNSPVTSANDYCIIAEFGEGQKWHHPYQNGGNPYHGRGAAMPKVGLHPNANVHGPWAQFCGLPLQTSAVQNPVIRPSRQMVFLQEQQGQHCNAFPDEMQMPYVQAKMEPNHRLHLAYSGQGDPQVKSSVSPPQIQHHQQLQHEEAKCGEASQGGWDSESTAGSTGVTGVPNMIQDQGPQDQEEEAATAAAQQVNRDVQEESSRQKPSNNKQPLPGFHQAFGSTEIGRFSRSEFFANMVGDNCSNNIPEAYLPAPVFPFSPTAQSVLGTPTMSSVHDEDLLQILPEDCFWLGAAPGQFPGHCQSIENATNYAAFLDYSHRLTMSQEWLHPGTTAQDLQTAFIEQPSLFHESGSLLGHEHLSFGGYLCPSYDQQNRQTPILGNGGISDENFNEFIEASEEIANAKQPVVIKQNDRICVMLEANQMQLEKDIM